MLWVACQDVSVRSSASTLLIDAPGENEYSLLSKPENVAKLIKYVQSYGFESVKIVKDDADVKQIQETESETKRVEEFFQGEILKIEE